MTQDCIAAQLFLMSHLMLVEAYFRLCSSSCERSFKVKNYFYMGLFIKIESWEFLFYELKTPDFCLLLIDRICSAVRLCGFEPGSLDSGLEPLTPVPALLIYK